MWYKSYEYFDICVHALLSIVNGLTTPCNRRTSMVLGEAKGFSSKCRSVGRRRLEKHPISEQVSNSVWESAELWCFDLFLQIMALVNIRLTGNGLIESSGPILQLIKARILF